MRFAVLPNGMRYAIMRNATPKGEVAIRFRIGAGSLDENDAQQGLAHFTEHMAFRGSTHVPESEVWTGMQRLGMSIGADTSAYTTETQTFYQLNLPNADPATVDFGLMRIREIASELTLSQTAMDAERGTVLGEERLRDTPDYRTTKAQRDFFFKGQWVTQRYPIGKVDIIQHAPVSLIRDFYNAYYRPERATLIVVGDIDPQEVEAKIKARFSDWTGVGRAGPDPDMGAPPKRDLADAADRRPEHGALDHDRLGRAVSRRPPAGRGDCAPGTAGIGRPDHRQPAAPGAGQQSRAAVPGCFAVAPEHVADGEGHLPRHQQ